MIEKVQIVKSVEKKIKDGNYKEALGEITRCLELYPTFIVAKVLKAECLYYLGHYDETLALLSEVLFSAPDNIKARRLAIEANLKLGNVDEAKTHLDFLSFILPANHPYIDEATRKINESQMANTNNGDNEDLEVEYNNVEIVTEKEEVLEEEDKGHPDMQSLQNNVLTDNGTQEYTNSNIQSSAKVLKESEIETTTTGSESQFPEAELRNNLDKSPYENNLVSIQSQTENEIIKPQEETSAGFAIDSTISPSSADGVVEQQEHSDDFLLHSEDIDSFSHSVSENEEFVSRDEKSESQIEELQEDNLITGVLPEQISTITLPEKEDKINIKTKTLALIYERQGMFEEALEILEKLFNENGDESLLKDIERIKAKMMGKGKNAVIVNKIKKLEDWLERVKWHSNN